MNTVEKVKEFHAVFEHPIGEDHNHVESREMRQLRLKLIFEELSEFAKATDCQGTFVKLCAEVLQEYVFNESPEDGDNVDKVEELDALCDLRYVIDGKLLTSGLWRLFPKAFQRVHDNNMAKAHRDLEHAMESAKYYREKRGGDYKITERNGYFIVLNESGKVMKPHDHKRVDLSFESLTNE